MIDLRPNRLNSYDISNGDPDKFGLVKPHPVLAVHPPRLNQSLNTKSRREQI